MSVQPKLAKGKAKVGYVLDEETIHAVIVRASRRKMRPSHLVDEILAKALSRMNAKEDHPETAATASS